MEYFEFQALICDLLIKKDVALFIYLFEKGGREGERVSVHAQAGVWVGTPLCAEFVSRCLWWLGD